MIRNAATLSASVVVSNDLTAPSRTGNSCEGSIAICERSVYLITVNK
jgi:hypothetical protein